MRRIRTWFALLGLVAITLAAGYAQQTSGNITGNVTDTSGAALPNATVTVTNTGTKQVRTTTTNGQGEYQVPDIYGGNYEVTVTAPGFKKFTSTGVVVHTSTVTTVNAQLTLGQVSEQVTVQADAIQTQTESPELGAVVDGRQVKQLPLNGRSFVELTQLQPGVSGANNFDTKNKGLQGGVDMSVNGNPTTNNLFLIDGVNNNDVGSNRTILIYPSNEAIAEFRMLMNDYGAQYGQASGAIISIVTRAGTNDFHGSVFYDGRNDALNPYTYLAKQNFLAAQAQGQTLPLNGKDKLRRNDWGYSVGGPIKRDKLFFFWSQEWNHEIRGRTVSACVPTAAELSGNFANPSCGEPLPNIPAQFQAPGNPYALNSTDAAASTLMKVYPNPNLASLNSNGQNWDVSLPTGLFWREENARVDFNLTPRNALMIRYTQDTWSNPAYNAGYWGDDPFPALNSSWAQPSKSMVARWTSTISSNLVNDVAFQYSNNRINITPGGTNPGLLPQITAAIPTLYPIGDKTSPQGIPSVNLGSYGSGNSTSLIAPWENELDLYTIQDDMTWVKGRHTFKFGGLLAIDSKNEDTGPATSERPSIGTSDSSVAPGGFATGNNLANFLLPNNTLYFGETSTNVRAQLRWRDYEIYATDAFKLTPRLTLSYGVRYSLFPPTYQPNNQITSFQPSLYDPSKPASDACNGLWVAPGTDPCGAANKKFGTNFSSGVQGPNRALVDTNYHMFAPRVGFNWDVMGDGKTVVSAGGGEFFQRERVSRYTLVSNAPFAVNQSNYPRTVGGATPTSLTGGTASPAGGADPRAIVPNSWQWNASVQQQLAPNTILQMAYVGNRGIHLTSSYDINTIPQQNWLQASFTNGAAQTALRPFSNYNTLTWWAHNGDSVFSALEVSLNSRFRNLQLQAAYTWSHSISDILLDDSSGGLGAQSFTYYPNPGLDRGNATTNRPNIFVANATYLLPQFTGRDTLVKSTLGGWELTGITTAENGNSFTIYQGMSENTSLVDGAGAGQLNSQFQTGFTSMARPLINGNQGCTSGSHNNTIVNPNAFTLIGYQIGTIPSNYEPRGYCHGPNMVNTDFSIDKNWKVRDRATIQFRMDFFDLFNHANFLSSGGTFSPFENVNCGPINGTTGKYAACSPTNNVVTAQTATPGFGTSTALVGNAQRQIQYGIHIEF
ncbi:MAG: carboxypeptidase regulatory-like domain-containing protein [Acidobacteria bacterium]|nr:carboxypeptidase regulatory-like domain-containing protein [Acidobacteriota bacterium]MBW4046319.1 carboxypeptidase regulatory-like domain-containing protein [Acidobacteriota bacterium]